MLATLFQKLSKKKSSPLILNKLNKLLKNEKKSIKLLNKVFSYELSSVH